MNPVHRSGTFAQIGWAGTVRADKMRQFDTAAAAMTDFQRDLIREVMLRKCGRAARRREDLDHLNGLRCYRIPGVAGCGPRQPRMKQPTGQFANGADMGLPKQDSGLQPG